MLSFGKIPVSERESALIQPHWLTRNKKPNLLTFEREREWLGCCLVPCTKIRPLSLVLPLVIMIVIMCK